MPIITPTRHPEDPALWLGSHQVTVEMFGAVVVDVQVTDRRPEYGSKSGGTWIVTRILGDFLSRRWQPLTTRSTKRDMDRE